MIAINFIDHGTVSDLQAIAKRVRNPEAMLKVVGRRGANELRAHFRRRNATPNKLGGRRSNFWNKIASSTNNPVAEGPGRVRISITDPRLAQKVYGGRITPKRRKALTIPVAPEAYDRTVPEFQQETGIQLFLLRKKGGGLTNLLAGAIGGSGHRFKVYYTLQPYVDQAADPEALPPPAVFGAALVDESQSYLTREVLRNKSNTT